MELPEINIILDLPPQLTEKDEVAIDLEIFGMAQGKLHRPNQGKFASLQVCFNGKDVYVITDETKVQTVLERIGPATSVFHGSDFDIRHLRRWAKHDFGNFSDTLGMERILSGGLFDTFGLKDLSRHYLSVLVDKKEREEFFTSSEMTREMLRYAALDPYYTWWVRQEQKKIIRPQDLFIWETIDRPAILTLLNAKGVRLDVVKWKAQAEKMQAQAEAIRATLGFNPNSWQQVKKALHEVGLDVPSTGEEVLQEYRGYPLVSEILDYRHFAKMASTYGFNFIEQYVEDGDMIYPHLIATQAETGRGASRDFNSRNIPSERAYRECFIPSDENHILLMVDYNAQEPRITAFESKDKNLLEAIQPGKKVHAEVGRRLFNDPTLVKGDPRYKKAKQLNLGLSYGLSARGLQKKLLEEDIKISDREANTLVKAYFENFPGVANYIKDRRDFAFKNGYVETHSGRRIWINPYSYQWQNNAINAPVQGGGADVIKRAEVRIEKDAIKAGFEPCMFNEVYDELDFNAPKDGIHELTEIVKTAMIEEAQAIYEGIPFEVEIGVGQSWADKE